MKKEPLTFEEFKKTIFYTDNKMVIPLLGRISIDKTKFINNKIKKKNKYDFEKEEKYLRKIYEMNKHKLI